MYDEYSDGKSNTISMQAHLDLHYLGQMVFGLYRHWAPVVKLGGSLCHQLSKIGGFEYIRHAGLA